MPTRFQNVIQNFAAGEISPRMSARVDFEAYNNALKKAKNFIISPQGGAMYREGFQYVGVPPSNQPFRIFQFRNGGDISDAIIEISPGLTRYWVVDENGDIQLYQDENTLLVDEVDDAILCDEVDDYQLTVGVTADANPYSVDDLPDLYFTNQDRYATICHPNHPPLTITAYTDGSLLSGLFPLERIPIWQYNDIKNPAISATSANWQITFPSEWVDTLPVFFMTYNNVAPISGGSILRTVFSKTPSTNIATIKLFLEAAAAQQGYTITVTPTEVTGTIPVGTVYNIAIVGADAGWTPKAFSWEYRNYSFTTDPIALTNNPRIQSVEGGDALAEPAWSYPTWVTHNGNYYQCREPHEAIADTEPGVGVNWEIYWTDLGGLKPEGFDYTYPAGNAWTLSAPEPDVVNYFPHDRGFPTVALYHDQRLLLMANTDNPTAIFGSGLGEFNNFITGPEDDNPFIHVLDSSDTPVIKWASSQQNVTLGTSGGDWLLKAEVTLTPTDIHAQQQNFARSDLNMVCQVDDEIFYIELGERKIRSTRYSRDSGTNLSTEVSILAEHLIATDGVHRIYANQTPETVLVMLRNNGQPVVMTYDKNMPVMAFSPFETDGFVFDSCGYYNLFEKRDAMVFATQRNGQYVLESMRYPCGKICTDLTSNDVVHLDSWVTGTVEGQFITGLTHLEGKTVHVLIDDAWQIGEYVVELGIVQLNKDFTGSLYAVGLPYVGQLETFEAMQAAQGTALGTKRRWNWLTTRLLNSALPKVYGKRSEDRTPSTPMNEPELQREGLQDVRQNVTGYGDGSILIEMDRPYPVQCVGFFGEYQIEQRK